MNEAFRKWCKENGLIDLKYTEAVLTAFIKTINNKADQLYEKDDYRIGSPYHDALFGLIAEFYPNTIVSTEPTTTSPLPRRQE